MKKLLCVLLSIAILMPLCAQAENAKKATAKKKKLGITVAFLDSLSHTTSIDALGKQIKEAGGKPKTEDFTVTVKNLALEGAAMKLLDASFDEDHLDNIGIMIETGSPSTYLAPGKKYQMLLSAAQAMYGSPYEEERKATYYRQSWKTDKLRLDLTYFSGRKGQRKAIWVYVEYVNPDKTPPVRVPIEMPLPKEFVWDDFRHDPDIGKEDKPGVVRMGMKRAQVMAAQVTELKSDKENALLYKGFLAGSMAATCEYRFDSAGKLCEIEARFTAKSADPSDDIFAFEKVDEWLQYAHLGQPEQEDPMVWLPASKVDPMDGSLWGKSVKKGELMYRTSWTIDGVRVEHLLISEKGKIVHMISCGWER